MQKIVMIGLILTLCFFTSCSTKPEGTKGPTLEEKLAKFLAGEWEYGGSKVIITYEGLKGEFFFRKHGGYFIQPVSGVPHPTESAYQGTWKVDNKNRITISQGGKSKSRHSSYYVFIIDENHIHFRETTPPHYDTNFVFTRLSASLHEGNFVDDLKRMCDEMKNKMEKQKE